jgi:hypothetical protein
MRDFGKLSTSLWRSKRWRKIAPKLEGDKAMSRLVKNTYFYMHTSPHGNSIGAYVVPPELASFDMQEPADEIAKAYQVMCDVGLIRYDEEEGLAQIIGFFDFNAFTSRKHLAGSLKVFHSLPSCDLKDLIAADIVVCIFHRTEAWRADLAWRGRDMKTPKDQADHVRLTEARSGFLEDASKLITNRRLTPILCSDKIGLSNELLIGLSDQLLIQLPILQRERIETERQTETKTETETKTQTETKTAPKTDIQAEIAGLTARAAKKA